MSKVEYEELEENDCVDFEEIFKHYGVKTPWGLAAKLRAENKDHIILAVMCETGVVKNKIMRVEQLEQDFAQAPSPDIDFIKAIQGLGGETLGDEKFCTTVAIVEE